MRDLLHIMLAFILAIVFILAMINNWQGWLWVSLLLSIANFTSLYFYINEEN